MLFIVWSVPSVVHKVSPSLSFYPGIYVLILLDSFDLPCRYIRPDLVYSSGQKKKKKYNTDNFFTWDKYYNDDIKEPLDTFATQTVILQRVRQPPLQPAPPHSQQKYHPLNKAPSNVLSDLFNCSLRQSRVAETKEKSTSHSSLSALTLTFSSYADVHDAAYFNY